MGRLNLASSNPVKDGIDAFTALSANYRADDADARAAVTAGLQNKAAQNQLAEYDNQQQDRQAIGLRMKIGGDVALTPEETAQAEQMSGVSQAPGVPVQQGIPLAMPADPRAATMQAAKSMAPSPLWKTPDGMTKEQQADHDALINTFSKMNQVANYVPTKDEYKLLAREVVNNPSFSDSGLAEQHKALDAVNSMFAKLQGITQPTQITDPAILAAINTAFPRIGQGSNLKGGQASKLFVQPSPDGDPAKARLTIGISGANEQGEVVDGIVTHNRSSDPNDTVMTVTGGAWMDMAQKKKQTLDGLLAFQAEHGNKEALPVYEQLQSNRSTAKAMLTQAESMEDGTSKSQLIMEARLLQEGRIPPVQAAAIAEKFYAPIHKRESAAAAQGQAIALKTMDNINTKEVHAADRASAEKVAAANNKTTLEVARLHAAAAKKAGVGATPALIQQAEWLMANKIAKNHADAWDMVKEGTNNPAKALEIYTASALKARAANPFIKPGDVGYVSDEEIGRSAIAFSNSVQASRSQAIPTAGAAPAPAVQPANRPPISSFKR